MLAYVLICLTFSSLLSCGAFADDSQCASLLLKNITDETQFSIVTTLLRNVENLLDDAKKYASVKTRCPVVHTVCDKTMDCPKVVCEKPIDLSHSAEPMDCAEVMEKTSSAKSGVYKIRPLGIELQIEVYCDMEDDGGGWTVFQRRGDFGNTEDYFYRNWQSYKKGFGDLAKEFWLGNDNIFALTNQKSNIIKVTLAYSENKSTYATYDEFKIENEDEKYKLHVSGYSGTAGDSFSYSNGSRFSTKDQDNDHYHNLNCAEFLKGAWWYNGCTHTNLNGMRKKESNSSDFVFWQDFKNSDHALKDTGMKIRPKDFRKNPDKVADL